MIASANTRAHSHNTSPSAVCYTIIWNTAV